MTVKMISPFTITIIYLFLSLRRPHSLSIILFCLDNNILDCCLLFENEVFKTLACIWVPFPFIEPAIGDFISAEVFIF